MHNATPRQALPFRLIGLGLLFLAILTLALATTRVYQVDEATNVYLARLIASGTTSRFESYGPLFLYPLGWLTKSITSSANQFLCFRLLFWLGFWCSIALIVRASGRDLRSRSGATFALLVAAVPVLWTYGLEIRHDNVILLGLLAMLNLIRHQEDDRPRNWIVLGVLAGFIQFTAFKALIYWVPLTLILAFHPRFKGPLSFLRKVASWALGAALALALTAGVHLACGTWSDYSVHFAQFLSGTAEATRFAPWSALYQFHLQAPLLVAGMVGALWKSLSVYRQQDWKARLASTSPEDWWLAACLSAFLINPTPFPYNLTIPCVALLLWLDHHLRPEISRALSTQGGRILWMSLWIGTHLLPSTLHAVRLLQQNKDRQIELMTMAESLTTPADPVWDGAGLVPSRPSVGYHWYVNFGNTTVFNARVGMEPFWKNPAPVVLPTYRMGYLPQPLMQFFQANYVALAEDFWVLGTRISTQPVLWQCLKPGRYFTALDPRHPADTLQLGGKTIPPGPIDLPAGPHSLRVDGQGDAILYWIGPSRSAIPIFSSPVRPGIFPIPNAF